MCDGGARAFKGVCTSSPAGIFHPPWQTGSLLVSQFHNSVSCYMTQH